MSFSTPHHRDRNIPLTAIDIGFGFEGPPAIEVDIEL